MPYSKSLGLIFVAIPKTGTTSVTRALSRIEPSEGGLLLLNELIDQEYRRKYRLNEIGDNKPGRGKHLSALQIKYILGDEEFDRCLKFSVVRNPWARMVSRYFFTHVESEPSDEEKVRRGTTRKFHDQEFETWISKRWLRHKAGKRQNSQWRKLVDLDGQLLVDHVGQLESVQDTLDWVSEQIGVERIVMPHVNGTRKGHYVKFYNDRTREMVADMCSQDIEFFNYQFDE
jgi:hypothetical protein